MLLRGVAFFIVVAELVALRGWASRPTSPPIEQVDLANGYRFV